MTDGYTFPHVCPGAGCAICTRIAVKRVAERDGGEASHKQKPLDLWNAGQRRKRNHECQD